MLGFRSDEAAGVHLAEDAAQNVEYEQLTDIIAFRVIVASVEDCYRALGVIHTHYRMIPESSMIILNAKLNGNNRRTLL